MTPDPIADMLTRIRNAHQVGKTEVAVPYSGHLFAIAEALQKEGYVDSVDTRGEAKKEIIVTLPAKEEAKIHGTKRVSRPSRRVYEGYGKIRNVKGGHGHLFLSTPQGVMTGEAAKQAKVGGEALFEIW